jgi:hypothetical protein
MHAPFHSAKTLRPCTLLYDTSQITCFASAPCHNAPWWNLANAAHGHETSASYYDTNGTTLLKQVNTSYQALCPPSGVSGTPSSPAYGNWNGHLVNAFDFNNPIAACDIRTTQQVTHTFNGSGQSVDTTTTWTYDSYGRVTQQSVTSNGGTPTQVVTNTSYVWNDNITATQNSASGTYIIDTVAFTSTEDGSGNRLRCSYTSYMGKIMLLGRAVP